MIDTPPHPLTGPYWHVTVTDPVAGTWVDGIRAQGAAQALANARWNWELSTDVAVNGRMCENGHCPRVAVWSREFQVDTIHECAEHASTPLTRGDIRRLGGLVRVSRTPVV